MYVDNFYLQQITHFANNIHNNIITHKYTQCLPYLSDKFLGAVDIRDIQLSSL